MEEFGCIRLMWPEAGNAFLGVQHLELLVRLVCAEQQRSKIWGFAKMLGSRVPISLGVSRLGRGLQQHEASRTETHGKGSVAAS